MSCSGMLLIFVGIWTDELVEDFNLIEKFKVRIFPTHFIFVNLKFINLLYSHLLRRLEKRVMKCTAEWEIVFWMETMEMRMFLL